jgi:hypothetical protein
MVVSKHELVPLDPSFAPPLPIVTVYSDEFVTGNDEEYLSPPAPPPPASFGAPPPPPATIRYSTFPVNPAVKVPDVVKE